MIWPCWQSHAKHCLASPTCQHDLQVVAVTCFASSFMISFADESSGVTGVLRTSRNAKWSSRPGCRKMTHKLFIPACPALPHGCWNTLGLVGGSTCTTKFTWGISRPCAATYVMRRREGMFKLVKAAKFFLRTLSGCLPCWGTGPNGRPSWWGSMAGRTCWKYSTAAQVDR